MAYPVKITLESVGEKDWCVVEFDNGMRWVPALHDLWRILYFIGIAEDRKYRWHTNANVKGADMVWESCRDAVLCGSDEKQILALCRKYLMTKNYKVRQFMDKTL